MGLLNELRGRARYVFGPVLGILVITYFAYHVVNGERGLFAWWQLRERIVTAKAQLTKVSAERETLENRVRLLHPESLDPDMLEERARVMLNYGHPDDIIAIDRKSTDGKKE